ncbi:dephospho-CoA kinase [Homoserinimonas aerilata]|uniref:Dephospho-CoA kinase n=1 Tax=Homoserinimonas aerilata TaxID=1162970 RepID=A0A542YJ00_9MICO|nr:dephospho-CoA kinase [Homoserinimonas aerilata]
MGRVLLIALTGGIASGKSLAAARLKELGAVHIDADALAREVVEPGTDGLAQIAEEFGPNVLQPDGSLDRAALGTIVFGDAERREKLNRITHPRVRELTKRRIADAAAADASAIVVYDVPLLVEGSGHRGLGFDSIVVVQADTQARIRRMVENRGMSEQEAIHRINSQATDAERLAVADVVLDNNGDVDSLIEQVDHLWALLRAKEAQDAQEHLSD